MSQETLAPGLPDPIQPLAPLTGLENAFWALDKLVPDSGIANLDVTVRTGRPLRWWPLHVAANHLLRRHPALRLRFPELGGVPVRHLTAATDAVVDVTMATVSPRTRTDELHRFARTPFDLAADLPFRVGCFSSPGEGSVVCLVVHHICGDVISHQTLLEELCRVYDAVAANRGIPADLVDEVAMYLRPDPGPGAVRYWLDQLDGIDPAAMAMPGARRAPSALTFAGRTYRHQLSSPGHQAMRRLREQLRVTDNIVLLSAFYLTLARHGAGPDLVVGVPVRAPSDQQRRVGLGVTTMPLRVRVDPRAGFRDLVRRTRDVFLGGVEHAEASVEDVIPQLPHRSGDWRAPVFRHLYNYRGFPVGHVTLGGGPVELVPLDDRSRLDIDFVVVPQPDGILLRVTYAAEVHDEEDIAAFVARLDTLLCRAGEDPDRALCELDVHTAADRQVLTELNATDRDWDGPDSALAMVARSAATAPTADAVVEAVRVTTYAELLASAAGVRDLLVDRGVRRGEVVALALGRGAHLAAAILGTWAAGAAFLPLDLEHPDDRLAFQLQDASAALVLLADEPAPPWVGRRPTARLPADPSTRAATAELAIPEPGDPAYLIYTSGTTGRPKGVLVSHASLANLVRSFVDLLVVDRADSVLWSTTPSFDISMLELLLPLCAGGRLIVADDEARLRPRFLLDLVKAHDVSVVQATPTAWRLIAEVADGELAGRTALCGGEPLPAELAARMVELGCRTFNVYGPTETTIWSTVEPIDGRPTEPTPVGRPLPNTRVFVMDRFGEQAPPGVTGELCVAGAGVSIGYLGRAELTEERFGTHHRWGRYYRTGDLARIHGGRLELLGRADRQVKLRGHRIELAEIESVLAEHQDVRAAAVLLDGDPQSETGRLLAFVQTSAPGERLVPDLYTRAVGTLPHYAVPERITVVDAFPTAVSGKIDYRRLAGLATTAPPVRTGRADDTGRADPELTARLLALWRQTLGRDNLSTGDSFFLNGGHSLLAVRLAARLTEVVGQPVPPRAVFDLPTPLAMAAHLTAAAEGER